MNTSDKEVVGYLLFKRIQIINANAISSPITYGFPAITGFLGAFHAISRKMASIDALCSYSLGGVLLACNSCNLLVYRDKSYSNYTFNQSRNPIKKDGKTASIIEEGKCHLNMTFVVEVLGEELLSDTEKDTLLHKTTQWIQQQRIAGGSVVPFSNIELVDFISKQDIDNIAPQIMPASILMDAQREFADIILKMQQINPNIDALDALIDVATLHHIPENILEGEESSGSVEWNTTSVKTDRGWLVPMPIGYQGISKKYEAGVMQNIRNLEYPSQYVEVIYGLGKWVYPHRINNNLDQAFWRYKYDTQNSLYFVAQTN